MPRGKAQKTLDLIDAMAEITEAAQPITVRGVAYKLFTRGLIPSMAKKETDKVSRHLTYAREQGIIPWEWIVDETHAAEYVNTWSSVDQKIRVAVNSYRRDYWQDQDNWVEVWAEKGTIRGVLRPVLDELGVTFRVMHGFGSATVINDIAEETQLADVPLIVLYVGDWDPSGMYMSEQDLPARLARYGGDCEISRVALSAVDVAPGTELPSFAVETKRDDARHNWFVERYGRRCWELDAMDPNDLRERVRDHIEDLIDDDVWQHAIEIEAAEVASMCEFHAEWQKSISGQAAKYSGGAE